MRSFSFKVVRMDPEDGSGVPINVAGQIMIDVQSLLTEIGCMNIRSELRLQDEIPKGLSGKFDLLIGGGSEGSLKSGPSEYSDALEDAVVALCDSLSFLGTGAIGSWMDDNFQDVYVRRAVAKGIIGLVSHLDGFKLVYGTPEMQREFRSADVKKLAAYAEENPRSGVSATVGIIARDAVRHNHWTISNGKATAPITFNNKAIEPSEIPSFTSAGPVIVLGDVIRDEARRVTSVEKVTQVFTFPEVTFHRIISEKGDRVLLNPITAKPSFSDGKWRLVCDEIGADVSKDSWDECSIAFHDYVEFLFQTYADPDKAFEGEEQEMRGYLLSLLPS